MGNRGCKLEGICLFLGAEAEGVESHIGELQLLGVIDGVYLHLPLAKKKVFSQISYTMDQKPEEEVVIGVG